MYPERSVWQHLHVMRHDRHSVERRLPIEDHNVSVGQVPFDDKAGRKRISMHLEIGHVIQSDLYSVGSYDVIRARVFERPVQDKFFQKFNVLRRGFLRYGEFSCYFKGNSDLRYVK